MKKLAKNNPGRTQRDASMTALRLQGHTMTDIATAHNVNVSTVSRVLSDDDCKAIIDRTIRKYISQANTIGDKFLLHCQSDDQKISLDAIKHYHQITGIAPSHTGNTILMQIYHDNRSLITPDVAQLVGLLSAQAGGDEDLQYDAEFELIPQDAGNAAADRSANMIQEDNPPISLQADGEKS